MNQNRKRMQMRHSTNESGVVVIVVFVVLHLDQWWLYWRETHALGPCNIFNDFFLFVLFVNPRKAKFDAVYFLNTILFLFVSLLYCSMNRFSRF